MKKSTIFLILFCFLSITIFAQTKPVTTKKTVTTLKKAPAKTTTTVKKTTTTTKPAPKPVVKAAAPVVTPVEAPPPTTVPQVQDESKAVDPGPPVTGPIGSGPKSYDPNGKTTTVKASISKEKTTKVKPEKVKTEKVAKVKAAKPDKIKKSFNDRKHSYIGIRGGYNLANLEGINEIFASSGIGTGGPKDLPGYMGGLVFNIGLSKAISIQPEILYSQQGFNFADGPIFIKLQEEIVNAPLLLKVAVGSPRIKLFVNAGPYIGYRIGRKSISNFTGSIVTEKEDFDTDNSDGEKDNIFDFGAIGGAGLQFNIGGPIITLEGRYQYGMADPILYKDGKDASLPKTEGHQRVMTGTIGLLFPIGGRK
jgi:hypothetical protein